MRARHFVSCGLAIGIVASVGLVSTDARSASDPCAGGPAALHETAAFLACARAASAPYQNRDLAILDGYRPIGGDFPAMAEHWIRVGLVFDGRLEPARPEVLTYLTVGGAPRLLGVAYAMPLLAGEAPPDWPAGAAAWHDHTRSIEDETILPHHDHGTSSSGTGGRIAMLHAWIWTPNPDGVFAAENWAIPFVRLGLTPPAAGTPDDAGRALSLACGGAQYFQDLDEASGPLSSAEQTRRRAAYARAKDEVMKILTARHESALSAAEIQSLVRIWADLQAPSLPAFPARLQ